MFKQICLTTIVLIGLAWGSPAEAQIGQRLKVGDPAPGLSIAEWVKGDETGIDPGTTYVVEFWATWCGPCRKSIPHLTELQSQYEPDQLRIIGISDEDPELVKSFVRKMGRKMDYTVAVDKRAATKRAWFKAAGLKGIPAAFIVGPEGNVQFIGNPLEADFGEILEKIIAGRYNRKLMNQAASHLKAIEKARKLKNWGQYDDLTNEVIQRDPRIFYFLVLDRFMVIMNEQKNPAKAYEHAQEAIDSYPDDPELLSWLAIMIANEPKIPDAQRNLDIALEAAQAARVNGRPGDPRFLMSEAIVHFQRGDVDKAVVMQEKAYFMAKPRKKGEYRPKLEEFRKKQAELQASSTDSD
ncbi:MAG: redoxin domain-containing protein [Phycisphaerales bacterium]|nr:redoxin domain-containing protein [Phycisphaerales bacterium]